MTVLDAAFLEEINKYFNCEWEEYSYKSAQVKAIKSEMDGMVETLYQAKELARYNEDAARSVVGIKGKLQIKHRELIRAIDECKWREQTDKLETERAKISQESNLIAKESKSVAMWSVVATIIIGIISVIVQLSLGVSSEEKIKKAVIEEVSKGLSEDKGKGTPYPFDTQGIKF